MKGKAKPQLSVKGTMTVRRGLKAALVTDLSKR
jgi:hypothetical protein